MVEYIHVRNMEKFYPKYKDRAFIWAKIHCSMVHGDPDCELIENEIDWGRLIKFILISLGSKKGIPLDFVYLTKKGINNEIRPISLTLEALHNFVYVGTEITKDGSLEKSRVEKSRVDDFRYYPDQPPVDTTAFAEQISEVITYLNTACKKNYSIKNVSNKKFISGRLNEGHSVDDLKKVIDKKAAEWLGTTMAKYLRPETLFNATKFESYHNEPDVEMAGSTKEMEDLI